MKRTFPFLVVFLLFLAPAFCAGETEPSPQFTTESLLEAWAHHHHKPEVFVWMGEAGLGTAIMFKEDIEKSGLSSMDLKMRGISTVEEVAKAYAPRLAATNREFAALDEKQKKAFIAVRAQNLLTGAYAIRYAGELKVKDRS